MCFNVVIHTDFHVSNRRQKLTMYSLALLPILVRDGHGDFKNKKQRKAYQVLANKQFESKMRIFTK